ncbi:PREDICTED: myosin-binding protein 7-like [Ipomoea nil]|uniref:myosin-binding protein 7-like n=1 Tax=Ipomoea nil TaxID=35883 RepID=UPI000901038C|nr:PREDICTED: myosin-binding protein 7-like [Ipomoea nil]XP_019153976.1 PREDICTED: myosin-binding protein 7-like [Ipomoea nil]
MDFESASPMSERLAKCCDCGCSCSMMNESFSGTWSRNMKRKYQEFDGTAFTIPGLILPQTARIDIENECAALREMVSNQQQMILDLRIELDKERNASSTAADEAMSMILRLQSEKAEIQMEFTQFKRFTEERAAHDQQEMEALEDLVFKREQTMQSLTCEVQMYKHRMLSYGFTESEADGEGEKRGHLSENNSMAEISDEQFELPLCDYPPLKCLNENQVCSEVENEIVDVEKYAFGETPHSQDHLQDLECRINQLERSPRFSQPDGESYKNNVLEKVIVDQSPHMSESPTDSSGTFFPTNNEMDSNIITESPKFGGSSRRTELPQVYEFSNVRKADNASDVEDDTSDRVYTIDSIHQSVSHNDAANAKATIGVGVDFVTSPTESSNYTNMEDPDVKKLFMRLQALEADRESMRQEIVSMRTDKAQLVLLKEIAQQLCKDMTPAMETRLRKPYAAGPTSFTSMSTWAESLVTWRRKTSRCKQMFGLSGNNAGLLTLLNKGPCVGQWRCLTSTQV